MSFLTAVRRVFRVQWTLLGCISGVFILLTLFRCAFDVPAAPVVQFVDVLANDVFCAALSRDVTLSATPSVLAAWVSTLAVALQLQNGTRLPLTTCSAAVNAAEPSSYVEVAVPFKD